MSNKLIKPNAEKAKKIIDEVGGKVDQYEMRMTTRLARWVEAAELYCGKTATQKENSKLSPNSAELFKAIRAIRNMTMRMLLGQKPNFELECMDIIGYEDPGKLIKAEHFITNQMDLAKYTQGLARALDQLLLYGTCAVHNPYEPIKQPFLGKKQYITGFRPISLINCAFSMDSYDISDCGWVAINDIQSKTELDKLLSYDPDGKVYDVKAINAAKEEQNYQPHVNTWVQQRMAWQGYVSTDFRGGMERTTYYGPVDFMNDGEDYCIEIINRQHIIRMESFDGIRPVRIATINTLDVEPLGNGMADMFRPLLQKIDDTESAMLNMITLAGASMFQMQKDLQDEDAEFQIRQFGIMRTNSNLNPIGPDPRNLASVAQYGMDNIQKFRQASGATDTLQALVTGDQATATATSLAMNEAVRNVSVQAELVAPNLHRDYVKMILQNAQKYNTEATVVHINGAPITVTPSDLLIDVNVRVKTTTDQDFRPAKLQRLREGIQLMAMFGPGAIPGKKVNPGPAITEYLKTLDVPRYNETIQDITEEDMLKMRMQAEMQQPSQPEQEEGEQEGGENGEEKVANEKPGRRETRMLNRNQNMPMAETMATPIGQTMVAPGDNEQSAMAIRKSSVK